MTEPFNPPSTALHGAGQHVRNSAQASTAPPAADLHRADTLPYADVGDETAREPDRESPPGTPRWVKAFGIGAVVLLLLFAGLHLTGNVPTHMPGSGGTEHSLQQAP